jgi:protein gp37
VGEKTKIEWASHSFNPFLGCSKVASGCTNCYAAAMAGRLGVTWGPDGTRRRTAASTWKQVEKWNKQAGHAAEKQLQFVREKCRAGIAVERPRVFPSLCDIFEDWPGVVSGPVGRDWRLEDVRRDFFGLIDRTPNLDWLLLTKRPENIRRMWPFLWGGFADGSKTRGRDRHNVWLFYSASDQQSLDAGCSYLLRCRDLVPVVGLSLEPLLGPIEFGIEHMPLSWVIVGGESGPHFRPMEVAWLESIADQCSEAGVPLFVKQDCGLKSGQQGRIPNTLWALKQFPTGKDA